MRFLTDRIMVCPRGSAQAVLEMAYGDVETVEVSGSGSSRSGNEQLVVILVLCLLVLQPQPVILPGVVA